MRRNNALKFVMIGESSVGKTCMIMRYIDNTFTESFLTTVGVDFRVKVIAIDGRDVAIQIWDTAGQEQFHTITKSYFRGADGIVLCFDLTASLTLVRTRHWMDSINESAAKSVNVVLVGNKSDKGGRQVSEEEARKVADEYQVPYFETSAKTGENIDTVFETLARLVMERKQTEEPAKTKMIAIEETRPKQKKQCC